MSISSSSFSAGYTGCQVITGVSLVSGKWRGFVVNEDCVVNIIRDKNAVNISSTLGLSTLPTLKQGTFISVADGDWISQISLNSGSIVAYNI